MEFLQAGLDIVLEPFLLPAVGLQTFLQMGVQDLLGETCVGHVNDMASPSVLVLHYCGGDTEHVGLLQNANVGTSVLRADPQNFS